MERKDVIDSTSSRRQLLYVCVCVCVTRSFHFSQLATLLCTRTFMNRSRPTLSFESDSNRRISCIFGRSMIQEGRVNNVISYCYLGQSLSTFLSHFFRRVCVGRWEKGKQDICLIRDKLDNKWWFTRRLGRLGAMERTLFLSTLSMLPVIAGARDQNESLDPPRPSAFFPIVSIDVWFLIATES